MNRSTSELVEWKIDFFHFHEASTTERSPVQENGLVILRDLFGSVYPSVILSLTSFWLMFWTWRFKLTRNSRLAATGTASAEDFGLNAFGLRKSVCLNVATFNIGCALAVVTVCPNDLTLVKFELHVCLASTNNFFAADFLLFSLHFYTSTYSAKVVTEIQSKIISSKKCP